MKTLNSRDEYLLYIFSLLPEGPRVLEVGVEAGNFSEKLKSVLNPSELHLLDPWERRSQNGKVYSEGHLKNIPTAYSDVNMQVAIERKYEEEIENGSVFIHRGYSYDLVSRFEDNYFDFIYLDGCHLYESVKQDIKDYYPKVAVDGILGGHDYISKETLFVQQGVTYSNQLGYGIKRAVDEFLDEHTDLKLNALVSDEIPFPDWAIRRKK